MAVQAEKEKDAKEASKKMALEASLKRFENVANRRSHNAKIIKVMVQKKKNGPWMMKISRADLMGDEDVNLDEVWKMGFSEWMEIRDILVPRRSESFKYALNKINESVERVTQVGLLPLRAEATEISQLRGTVVKRKRSRRPREAEVLKELIEQRDVASADPTLHLKLPVGVDPIEGEFILKPKMGMFFKDPNLQRMCFQRVKDLHLAQTRQLVALRLMCCIGLIII